MSKKWMSLVREGGNKKADWEIVAQNAKRKAAKQAAIERCKSLGIAYELGYKFKDKSQQICYADGSGGTPILGKIIRQSDNPDDIHSVPWTL
jgi:hypothetical protein